MTRSHRAWSYGRPDSIGRPLAAPAPCAAGASRSQVHARLAEPEARRAGTPEDDEPAVPEWLDLGQQRGDDAVAEAKRRFRWRQRREDSVAPLAPRTRELERGGKIQSTKLLPGADRREALERPAGGPFAVRLVPAAVHTPEAQEDGQGVPLRCRDAGSPEDVREARAPERARTPCALASWSPAGHAGQRGTRRARHAASPGRHRPARSHPARGARVRAPPRAATRAAAAARRAQRCQAVGGWPSTSAAARRTVAASTWERSRV